MEIIEIPGYTEFEKLKIATGFIIPKQIEENGLSWADIRFQENAILEIVRGYTMESGVRNLEREIAGIIRKIARDAVKKGFAKPQIQEPDSPPADTAAGSGNQAAGESAAAGESIPARENAAAAAENHEAQPSDTPVRGYRRLITAKSVPGYLGKRRFQRDLLYKEVRPGLAYGLAWTEMGGTLLPIEVAILEGEGELILTGSLGDVMKESARTALSFIRPFPKVLPSAPLSKERRHPHPCARRSDPQGRPFRRHYDHGRPPVRPFRNSGDTGHGHDRGDHPHGKDAAHRRG
jgi:ATP-dependent Lon protease